MKWGTFEASYDNLPVLLHTICQRNSGSFYDVKTYPCAQIPGKQVLQGSFLALGPYIKAFHSWHWVLTLRLSYDVDQSFALMAHF